MQATRESALDILVHNAASVWNDAAPGAQISKRGNSLRVVAEAVRWGRRRPPQYDQPGQTP